MPLSEQQVTWTARFTGGKGVTKEQSDDLDLSAQVLIRQDQEARAELVLRETYIRQAHAEAEALRDDLSVFQEKIQVGREKMDTIGKGGDQTKAFDVREDGPRLKAVPESLPRMMAAKEKMVAIQNGLLTIKVTRSALNKTGDAIITYEAPLFEDPDIENELYTPLVRGLLYPEDQVEERFSATQRMINGSNDALIEKLETYVDDENKLEQWGPVLKSVVSAVKDLSSATVGLVAGVELSNAESGAEALKILETQNLVNLGLTVGEAVINTSIDVAVSISKADAANGVSVVLSGLSGAVSGLVKQYTGNSELASLVKVGMKAGSRLPLMIKAVAGDADPEVKAGLFMEQLGGLLGDAFDFGAVLDNDPDDPNNLNEQKQIALCKTGVTMAYAGIATALKTKLASSLAKGDWNGAAQSLVKVSGTLVKGALNGVAAQEALDRKDEIGKDADGAILQKVKDSAPPNTTDEELQSLYDAAIKTEKAKVDGHFAKASAAQEASIDSVTEGMSGLIGLGKGEGEEARMLKMIEEKERAEKEAREAANKSAEQEAEDELKADQDRFRESLRLMEKDQLSATELKSIGKLIAELKRDKFVIQTAFAVGSAGFAVAQQFFAPMALAGTLVKFTETMVKAINRAVEMRNWVDASEAALNAVSPYLTAIQNFVKNQAEQFAYHTIKAALIAVQAAGQIMQIAGAGTYAQAAGIIVEKGAKLAETLEDLIYKAAREATLRKAWKITKKALNDPQNRKANLLARKINPTLAKYTLAFGAVVDKDPVALQAFNIIGLDAETLAAKDAKVSTVVSYLEARYDEDIQVYKTFSAGDDDESAWLKGAPAPALTVDCFVTLHFIAIDKGGIKDTNPNQITRAFHQVEAARTDYAAARKLLQAADRALTQSELDGHRETFQAYEDAVRAVRDLLLSFAPPLVKTPRPSDAMQSALRELADLTDVELGTIDLERAELIDRPPPPLERAPPSKESAEAALKSAKKIVGDEDDEDDED